MPRSRSPRERRRRSRSRSPRDRRDDRRGGDRRDDRRDRDRSRRDDRDRDRGRDRDRDRDRGRDSDRRGGGDRGRDARDNRRAQPYTNDKLEGAGVGKAFKTFQQAMEQNNNNSAKKSSQTSSSTGANSESAMVVDKEQLAAIARKKEAEEQANLKPVFMTKKQRQEAALKRLQEKRAEQSKQEQAILDKHRKFEREASSSSRGGSRYDARRAARESREERLQRQREREKRHRERREGGTTDKHKELQLIKENYLGKKKKKKKILPPSQKFKFNFDWEAGDDTSQDHNALYNKKHGSALLYGRGFLGGVDRREQRKSNNFYEDMIKAKGQEGAVAELIDPEVLRQRELKAAEKEKAAKMANRHWKEKSLEEMEERDWRIFKEDFNITTRGQNVPNPMRYWDEPSLGQEGLSPTMLATLERIGYKEPTPIQRAAIPVGLANVDVVGIAETGSGKTCAFLLPMLSYISTLPKLNQKTAAEGPYALIMAPTRELAQQIAGEADKFSADLGITTVSIVGGVSHEDQAWALRDGAEILIATPGRLFDCIERRYLVLNQCNYVVLDEADRMIDLNFEPQILQIMDMMPSTNLKPEDDTLMEANRRYRQTIMFSATMPLKVEQLAKKYLRHPVFIAIGDRSGAVSDNVEQRVKWTTENMKRKLLTDIIGRDEPPFIVFCNEKKTCDGVARHLNSQGHRATVIHGGKIQTARQENLQGFKDGDYDILVATDVVGRGIDVSGVKQVINYDLPGKGDIEKYTHRIGRTGRAGLRGVATSFITEADTEIMWALRQALLGQGAPVPAELERHEAAKIKPGTVSQRRSKPTIQYAKK